MAIREATPIVVSAEERTAREAWVRAPATEQQLVKRARIVLIAAGGWASRAIASDVGCARDVVRPRPLHRERHPDEPRYIMAKAKGTEH